MCSTGLLRLKAAEPTVVNGINVDDLLALIDRVIREPAKGKTSWHVTTTWQGQARSRAEIQSYEIGGETVPRRFSIDIDEPRDSADRTAAPQTGDRELATVEGERFNQYA